ncbi:MAG: glycosyltransferase family 2 protein [Gemmatimonadota bacterium]|nr:glycosyltransferase family 2 protein [Gemmatimonadota bacterium]
MDPLRELAVVIPVAPGDRAWETLLADLRALPAEAEVVLAGSEAPPPDLPSNLRWARAQRGRARQMNAGARATDRTWLWFLHADSRFAPDTLPSLRRALATAPDALHFFDLAFLDDGPALMRLNQAGAWIRSRWGGMPFGDQGFCLRRELWERLGAFRTDAPYGEDHLLAWKARRERVPLRPTGGTLRTSARRYRERGWLATTARHLRLTALQAFPEWVRLLRG